MTRSQEIELIFEEWKKRQPRPQLCRLTEDRKSLIRQRLSLGYDAADFVALIEYFFESNDSDAKWMRGENPRRKTYLDLDNLLRKGKLAGRVEAALLWKLNSRKNIQDDDDNFGPFRLIRGGGA